MSSGRTLLSFRSVLLVLLPVLLPSVVVAIVVAIVVAVVGVGLVFCSVGLDFSSIETKKYFLPRASYTPLVSN